MVNKDGALTSSQCQHITGKINGRWEMTALENEVGIYILSYSVRGLIEMIADKKWGKYPKIKLVIEQGNHYAQSRPLKCSRIILLKDMYLHYG